jgi:alpha-ribazole phosphatase/probable phosphoglycerate mutase
MRHGEPVGGRRYRGHIDDSLSEKGWQQMWSSFEASGQWDQIVCSDLKRCADFADEISQRFNIPCDKEPLLREISFGTWEGRTADEINTEEPGAVERFKLDPVNFQPEGAEPLDLFEARVLSAWNCIVEKYQGKRILVIGHAGQIRMVLRINFGIALDGMFRLDFPNASITRLIINHDPQMVRLLLHT